MVSFKHAYFENLPKFDSRTKRKSEPTMNELNPSSRNEVLKWELHTREKAFRGSNSGGSGVIEEN